MRTARGSRPLYCCRYARKDRRPLDTPPVVQLKLYDVEAQGTAHETHREFDSYECVPRPSLSLLSTAR